MGISPFLNHMPCIKRFVCRFKYALSRFLHRKRKNNSGFKPPPVYTRSDLAMTFAEEMIKEILL